MAGFSLLTSRLIADFPSSTATKRPSCRGNAARLLRVYASGEAHWHDAARWRRHCATLLLRCNTRRGDEGASNGALARSQELSLRRRARVGSGCARGNRQRGARSRARRSRTARPSALVQGAATVEALGSTPVRSPHAPRSHSPPTLLLCAVQLLQPLPTISFAAVYPTPASLVSSQPPQRGMRSPH